MQSIDSRCVSLVCVQATPSSPIAVFERIKDAPVGLDVTYVLIRLVPGSTRAVRATGELLSLPEMSSCATRIDTDADEVELGCLTQWPKLRFTASHE